MTPTAATTASAPGRLPGTGRPGWAAGPRRSQPAGSCRGYRPGRGRRPGGVPAGSGCAFVAAAAWPSLQVAQVAQVGGDRVLLGRGVAVVTLVGAGQAAQLERDQ